MDKDAASVVITVTRDAALGRTVTVDYATSDGSATADDDYTAASGTLTFAPGVTGQSFSVGISDDALDEDDETVTLTLSDPVNAVVGGNSPATLTIVDNDALFPEPEVITRTITYAYTTKPDG